MRNLKLKIANAVDQGMDGFTSIIIIIILIFSAQAISDTEGEEIRN